MGSRADGKTTPMRRLYPHPWRVGRRAGAVVVSALSGTWIGDKSQPATAVRSAPPLGADREPCGVEDGQRRFRVADLPGTDPLERIAKAHRNDLHELVVL